MGKENSRGASGASWHPAFKHKERPSEPCPPSRLPQPPPSARGRPQSQQQHRQLPNTQQGAATPRSASAAWLRRPPLASASTPRGFGQLPTGRVPSAAATSRGGPSPLTPGTARGLPPPPGLRLPPAENDGSRSVRHREPAPASGSSTYRDVTARRSGLPGPPVLPAAAATRRPSNLAPSPPRPLPAAAPGGSPAARGDGGGVQVQQQEARQLADLQEERLGLVQQQARASHEQRQLQQQIR